MTVSYKLEIFEGPLDLLLHLIDKAEVDIYDIPIHEITTQYLAYLQSMQQMELEVTSEFLVMAATLLAIKSSMLLPKPPVIEVEYDGFDEEGDDPREQLIQQLIEYRKYKEVAAQLREKEVERSLIFTREPDDLSAFLEHVQINPVEGLGTDDLLVAYQRALRKLTSRQTVAKIRRDEISVKDRMKEVELLLTGGGGRLLFSHLFDDAFAREEVVVTFLALLELMKMKRIKCYQHGLFEDIVIQTREVEVADGVAADEVDH